MFKTSCKTQMYTVTRDMAQIIYIGALAITMQLHRPLEKSLFMLKMCFIKDTHTFLKYVHHPSGHCILLYC